MRFLESVSGDRFIRGGREGVRVARGGGSAVRFGGSLYATVAAERAGNSRVGNGPWFRRGGGCGLRADARWPRRQCNRRDTAVPVARGSDTGLTDRAVETLPSANRAWRPVDAFVVCRAESARWRSCPSVWIWSQIGVSAAVRAAERADTTRADRVPRTSHAQQFSRPQSRAARNGRSVTSARCSRGAGVAGVDDR